MRLPLGTDTVDISLPDCDVTVLDRPGGTPVDPTAAAREALDAPHGPPLSTLVDPTDDVTIVVTDVTRATPDGVLVGAMMDRLPVDREQVSILVGLGLHRPMTDAELRDGLGEYADLAVNHDPEATVEVGTVEGVGDDRVPVRVHPLVANADSVLSTGMVEPHQYAGFSGGAKTVVIGAGDGALIGYTHGPDVLSRPGVRLGRIDDNPFRATVDRAGDAVGLDFCLNVTKGPDGILAASAGRPRAVVADLAATAREALSVPLSDTYDAVIGGVGAPKDANLYQTTRAFTYLVLGDHNPVSSGGRVVVPARLGEGAGEGTGETRFYDRLRTADDADALYEAMREGYDPGAQRAFVVARALRDHDLYITNAERPDVVEACPMHAAARVADAVDPGSRVLAVPDALNTLLVEA
ncbi:lactate racemase domain-containing protein [Haloplanus halobius]|uniref:lactate racemase domain-containing protein n=1 Tax=Haloplanus halobius TaxID=2934938 RepID=UPI0020109675|nr:lactate racemase domain-containing protein [Haloplanus sp. XH21]